MNNRELLMTLMQTVYSNPKEIPALIRLHANSTPLEIAQQMDRVYVESMQNQQFVVAERAAMVAGIVYIFLGKQRESLSSLFDSHEARFQQANTAEEYTNVYEGLKNIILKTTEIGDRDLAFRARVLSANCMFFKFEGETDNSKKQTGFEIVLHDLAAASKDIEYCTGADALLIFISLLSATYKEVSSWYLPTAEVIEDLKQLAAAAESSIPKDFEWHGDAEKTVQIARQLADLSFHYGNARAGEERLEVAMSRM